MHEYATASRDYRRWMNKGTEKGTRAQSIVVFHIGLGEHHKEHLSTLLTKTDTPDPFVHHDTIARPPQERNERKPTPQLPGNPVVRIVVVEDSDADSTLIKMAITTVEPRAHIEVFDRGHLLLSQLSTGELQHPDLILLDLNLPGINGSQVLARIRSFPEYRNTPVLILTSSTNPSDRARAMELGATDYLIKPIQLDEFLALGPTIMGFTNKQHD